MKKRCRKHCKWMMFALVLLILKYHAVYTNVNGAFSSEAATSASKTLKKAGLCTITAKANGKTAKSKMTAKKKLSLKKKMQHKKYVSYIKKFDKKNQDSVEKYRGVMYTGSPSARTFFVFVDIDKNGTDECIVQFTSGLKKAYTNNGAGGQFGRTEIYTIKNGKVKTVVEQGAAFCGWYPVIKVYKNSSFIHFYTSGHSLNENKYYTYKNGNLSKNAKYSYSYIMGGTYYVNDRETTQAEYDAFLKKMETNRKGYPMYVYSMANLKKFL